MLDLGRVATRLLHGEGMAFHDQESRKTFFEAADANPEVVGHGTAMRHARSTNLGVWGSESTLLEECAHILAYELTPRLREEALVPDIEELTQLISRTTTFQSAFRVARQEPDTIVSMSLFPGRAPGLRHSLPHIWAQGEEFSGDLHEEVIGELRLRNAFWFERGW